MILNKTIDSTQSLASGLVLAAALFSIAFAWGYVFVTGNQPCELCLAQRVPYYVGIPIAIYHAGVEWGYWRGPEACTGDPNSAPTSAADLLSQLNQPNTTPVVRCDEPYFRFLGLSFAGWNVLASLGLAMVALVGAFKKPVWR